MRAVVQALRLAAQAQRALGEALEAIADEVERGEGVAAPEVGQDDGPRLLTVGQAADRVGMSTSHVYRAVEEGRLAKVKFGAAVRIRVEDLDRYVEEHRVSSDVAGLARILRGPAGRKTGAAGGGE